MSGHHHRVLIVVRVGRNVLRREGRQCEEVLTHFYTPTGTFAADLPIDCFLCQEEGCDGSSMVLPGGEGTQRRAVNQRTQAIPVLGRTDRFGWFSCFLGGC